MLTEIFNEAFGMIAVTFLAFGAATSDDRKQLKLTNIGLIFLAVQVSVGSSLFAGLTIVLSIVRNFAVLHFSHVQWLKTAFMLLFVSLLCFSVVNINVEQWFNVLPALGGVVGSYAVLYLARNQRTLAFLCTSGIWMAFGVNTGLFSVVMTETILSLSLMIRLVKLYRIKQ